MQELVRRVPVAEHVIDFARDLTRATPRISGGAGLRARDGLVGRGAARGHQPDHGGEGAGGALRAVSRDDGGCGGGGVPGAAARVLTTFNAERQG